MAERPVNPDDALKLTIELGGFLGVDFASVAGKETARGKMLQAATEQVDAFIDSITVRERKP